MAQLNEALAAARIGAWHKILQVECGSDAAQIERARRTRQRSAHPDKGGSAGLSQLINVAADTLLKQSAGSLTAEMREWLKQERERDTLLKRERAARAAEEAARVAAEAARVAAEAARAADAEREHVIHSALSHQSKRGGKARSKVYLSPSTRILFPRIGLRIWVLQKKGQWEKGLARTTSLRNFAAFRVWN